eukprot:CAMPEP_0181464758 /NCGR_PEP_ID=MMETSP1110-20121109/35600_1 /TAXON_ID=174948 /ORGANISM="Symbiodinium sp., Strain CCMP421" /LENGTH=438 /DNA_ID=CAMNT_0023589507 /DNA_START=48 /DNA_END=1364 /DNA_ORIENTATION=-
MGSAWQLTGTKMGSSWSSQRTSCSRNFWRRQQGLDLFLSYSWGRDNKYHRLVKQVEEALRGDFRFGTFLDYQHLKGGKDLWREIQSAVGTSKCMVVFVSECYNQKMEKPESLCFKELSEAEAQGKLVLPVVLEPCMKDTSTWSGPLSHLGAKKYLDWSYQNIEDAEDFELETAQLAKDVNSIVAQRKPSRVRRDVQAYFRKRLRAKLRQKRRMERQLSEAKAALCKLEPQSEQMVRAEYSSTQKLNAMCQHHKSLGAMLRQLQWHRAWFRPVAKARRLLLLGAGGLREAEALLDLLDGADRASEVSSEYRQKLNQLMPAFNVSVEDFASQDQVSRLHASESLTRLLDEFLGFVILEQKSLQLEIKKLQALVKEKREEQAGLQREVRRLGRSVGKLQGQLKNMETFPLRRLFQWLRDRVPSFAFRRSALVTRPVELLPS